MRGGLALGPPALERAADELAHHTSRFEVYAKAGETFLFRFLPGGRLERRQQREVGVGCRAAVRGLVGFGAAAGSAPASGRDAARATLASLLPGPDPLPPFSLLGASAVPPAPSLGDPAGGEQLLGQLAAALTRTGEGLSLQELRLLLGRSVVTLVTGEGFAAAAASAACLLEAVVAAEEGPWRVFQFAARSPAELDVELLATTARETTLLLARGTAPREGLVDALLAPPVAATLVAALAEHLLAGKGTAAGRAGRVSEAWHLVDARAGPQGLVPMPFDGEGLPSRRLPLAAQGVAGGRLGTWADAQRFGCPWGAAVRPSYQHPPRAGPANLVVTPPEPLPQGELLHHLERGVFVPLCSGPVTVDESGRFSLPVAAASLRRGRVAAVHPAAELRGSFRRLLGGLLAGGEDAQSFSLSCAVTTPSLLVRGLTLG